jgi:hypothetical protein
MPATAQESNYYETCCRYRADAIIMRGGGGNVATYSHLTPKRARRDRYTRRPPTSFCPNV